MRFWGCAGSLLALVLVSVIIAADSDAVDPDNGLTQPQKDNIVSEHNEFRRSRAIPAAKNMIELRWDPKLAKTAFNYLSSHGCAPFQHNPDPTSDYHALGGDKDQGQGVGENWYSGKPDFDTDTPFDTPDGKYLFGGGAARAWVQDNCQGITFSGSDVECTDVVCSESNYFYNEQKADGSGTCTPGGWFDVGHFTQLMWATTAWVGCGWTDECGTLCNYAPAGNSANDPDDLLKQETIWKAGAADECPDGSTPLNGLCQLASTCDDAVCSTLNRENCDVAIDDCGVCISGFSPPNPDDATQACIDNGGTTTTTTTTTTTIAPTPTPTPTPKTKPSVTVKSNVANPVELAQSVTFTITVTGSTPKPTGKIKVFDGTKLLTPIAVALSNGVATFITSALVQGSHLINAQYSGDGSYLTANSPNLAVQVVSTPFFETFTNILLTKGTFGKAPSVSTLTHNYNGGKVTKSSTKFTGAAYKFPYPKFVTTTTIQADKPVTISITPVRTTIIYLYASAWPVGTYTFNKSGFIILSKTGTASISGNTLTVKTAFSGIISVPAKISSFKITGPPKLNKIAKSKPMLFALALPSGGAH